MPDTIPPLSPRPEVLAYFETRRSRPGKTLRAPGPDRDTLAPLLETALRVPDHGKLEPWRLMVLEGAALARLAEVTERLGTAQGRDAEKLAKARAMFADAPLVVAVVANPKASDKIPEVEQTLSVGALCFGLVSVAQAAGWGANWLSGWMATDRAWLTEALQLAPTEWVAGFVVIGTESAVPPERPRPDVAALTEWISE
ncbi:nitroreductase family protein [Jannaschia marina]|uniref:nitroreductase family protein n=1 Tax=Jannaschia marina TaxID=2741674 RepID=UPI0015C84792|nr:nitroreductase [Jannaschia marina]